MKRESVIIIGAGLGGLECAYMLAKNGMNKADQADFSRAFAEAVEEKFGKKPGAVEANINAYNAGLAAMK